MAAQFLTGRGFKEVYNLKGGIKAWQGLTAMGPVELNLDLISGQETPAEMIIIAYGLEEALSHFYRVVVERIKEEEVSLLLKKLGDLEERHKKMLRGEYEKIMGAGFEALPKLGGRSPEILEGGFKFSEFLNQNEAAMQTHSGVLDVAMMLEAQALDLYRRFGMKATQEDTQTILYKIADEEKAHLEALGKLRDKQSSI